MNDGPVPEAAGTTVPASDPDELTTTDPAPDATVPDEPDTEAFVGRPGLLRPVLFRLHFFGGFFAAPIALWLALTGVLFAWNPQIESWIFGDERNATAEGDLLPLSEQVDAVLAAYPDHEVVELTPADEAGEASGVLVQPTGAVPPADFGPAPGSFTAYVDPVDASVTGTMREESRPDEWIRNLHSNFRLGTRIGTLTELAASWVLVSLLTGIYLWWPKSQQALRRTFSPKLRGLRRGSRRQWKDLHSSIGMIILVFISVMVVTGLTWTEYAGRWVDVAKDAVSAEAPSLNTELEGGEAAGDGEHHEQGSGSESAPAADLDDVDQVAASATAADLRSPFTITPPSEAGQAWQVAEVDNRWPLEQRSIAVDPATGEVADRMEFSDQPMIDQLTSLGIGFHEASLFGLVNQVFLTLLAAALAVMLLTGYVMWWKRRPKGAFGPPPKFGPLVRSVPIWVVVAFLALMVLLPAMGVSFLIYLVVERLIWLARGRPSASTPSAPTTTGA